MAGARALAIVLAAAFLASHASALTNPDQFQILTAFRDAMLSRPQHSNWSKALASWTCPTDPGKSVGSACDPCGSEVWGQWDHMACRGARVSHDKYELPGSGVVTNIHITDYSIEGPVPLEELCPLRSLREFDVDGGKLTGPVPTGFSQCFPELKEIDLSYNQLTGTLPPQIAQNKVLEMFKVEHNELSGTIPSEYGSMDEMEWFRFAANKFSGTIPASLSQTAAHLAQLTLDENDFSGNLYALANHRLINFNAADNPKMCGMVPVGLRFAHGFNFHGTGLGRPCPDEVADGWKDLSESI